MFVNLSWRMMKRLAYVRESLAGQVVSFAVIFGQLTRHCRVFFWVRIDSGKLFKRQCYYSSYLS